MAAAPASPEALAILEFYRDAGVTTAEADTPGGLWGWDEAAAKTLRPPPRPDTPKPKVKPTGVSAGLEEALAQAEQLAASCTTLEDLTEAIREFTGCPLHESARGAVVHDGVLGADILVMGEAPGREEDRQGKPFVGRSGQLLDRMLAAIGVSRVPEGDQQAACITNAVYWRPPGNRNPTTSEVAVCLPFAKRFIALSKPKLVFLAGIVPTKALFPDAPKITRARGVWREIELEGLAPIPALPIFHPAFLLRQPAQKRWAWQDLLKAQAKLNETRS
ncbi:uracil-DNA glycosylase [Parvularcula lutaonensis]|uniref:Type-4 uracil-DNA glycosylase n=1 Tax=Parvularcula lutaonensis TaxID=491923 RepID=A0ABV7MA52_9PROT|nr:uracil-DNA glycosylase [Parvularcula lutaonensis]GGY44142.1 uracil-DNA glycosylase [Parvularcula lutaonensis]